ncbi:hypothetical protein BJ166DRAFT_610086 [Pestalotiopsis sp. NC0098]|nr:hypothetical protein BJ166DRAFT_610086 [Pestalotiopsis sp. NC0098]
MAIFRRFDDISALRLLSLQAEILELRYQFHYQCKINDKSASDSREKKFSSSFSTLGAGRALGAEQARLMDVMFSKLDQYYKCIIQATQIADTRVPDKQQLKVLQNWLRDEDFLSDAEGDAWFSQDTSMYLSPSPSSTEGDAFTASLLRLLKHYHRFWGHRRQNKHVIDEESGMTSYRDESIEKASRIITAAVSSVLPVMTIYILNILDTNNKRIGFTAAMTSLFAACLAWFTHATKVEILSATATFAAVEVVYIGTVLGNQS